MTRTNDYNGTTLRHRPDIFSNRERAHSWALRSIKPMWVIMGNVGEYLIVCPSDASRLMRAGYELS